MGILDIILGRKSVYGLRKEYDRIREKADRERNMNKRTAILRFLDQLEPTLITLEEHITSNFEKRRMTKYIGEQLSQAKRMLKDKEYFSPMIKSSRQ